MQKTRTFEVSTAERVRREGEQIVGEASERQQRKNRSNLRRSRKSV